MCVFRRLCLIPLAILLVPWAAIAQAQDLFVLNENDRTVRRYDGVTGAPKPSQGNTGAVFLDLLSQGYDASDIAFGPDGNLYITDTRDFRVLRYDVGQGTIGIFTPTNSRLNYAENLRFGPDGNLYVSSNAVIGPDSFYNGIFRFNGSTGASLPSAPADMGTTVGGGAR